MALTVLDDPVLSYLKKFITLQWRLIVLFKSNSSSPLHNQVQVWNWVWRGVCNTFLPNGQSPRPWLSDKGPRHLQLAPHFQILSRPEWVFLSTQRHCWRQLHQVHLSWFMRRCARCWVKKHCFQITSISVIFVSFCRPWIQGVILFIYRWFWFEFSVMIVFENGIVVVNYTSHASFCSLHQLTLTLIQCSSSNFKE